MNNKDYSFSILVIGFIIPIVLLVSREPSPGRIMLLGFLVSIFLVLASVVLAKTWKDQRILWADKDRKIKFEKLFESILSPILVFIWPILIFWQLTFPTPFVKAISNDFVDYYFTYKNYLINHLIQFDFPLWAPVEAGGFPFYSSPLTQSLYIGNIPYTLYGIIRGGITILSYQIFTIFGISIFALGLFYFLRQFKVSRSFILLISLVIPISFKLIETARFPNAVHTAAWFPWILLVITKLSFQRRWNEWVLSSLLLALIGIFTITAGYPYFVYYLIFLILPYVGVILVPQFREELFPDPSHVRYLPFIGSLSAAGLLTLGITLPYLVKMQDLLSQTTNRAGKTIEWTAGRWSSTFADFIGSLVFPPAASSEGWFYFGIFLLLVIIYFVTASIIRSNIRDGLFSRRLMIVFLLWLGFIAYLSSDGNQSSTNFLWLWLWNVLPGFNSLRIWARINIILLPIISILAVFALQYFFQTLKRQNTLKDSIPEMIVISLIAVSIVTYQSLLINKGTRSEYWGWMDGGNPATFLILSILGVLLFFGLQSFSKRIFDDKSELRLPFLILILLFCIFDARGGQLSPWMWIIDARAKDLTKVYSINTNELYQDGFSSPRVFGNATIPLDGSYNLEALRISWHFQSFVDFLNSTDDQIEDRKIFLGQSNGTRLFFTSRIDFSQLDDFLHDASLFEEDAKISVLNFAGDSLSIIVDSQIAGYLSYIDNWDSDWVVIVDGKEQEIELLFNTFKSVYLSPGHHQVLFKYQPELFQ